MDKLEENIGIVRQKIQNAAERSGRKASEITLVAVTKTVDNVQARMAYQLGIKNFGENRARELNRKMESLPEAKWHMIGRLQSNKVKDVVGKAFLIHSLDRWKLAEELDKRAQNIGVEVPTLLQVNISGEEQKAGIETDEVEAFLDSVGQLGTLKIYGLMTIAPLFDDAEKSRPIFKELYGLQQRFVNKHFKNVDLKYLSMGMSQDFEIAIEEGANIIRVGSAIFH